MKMRVIETPEPLYRSEVASAAPFGAFAALCRIDCQGFASLSPKGEGSGIARFDEIKPVGRGVEAESGAVGGVESGL